MNEWLSLVDEVAMETLPDSQVLALSELQMTEEQQTRLSELLSLNREGLLGDTERIQLDELMEIYCKGLLLKARALRAAVERGLREPLQF